MGIKNIILGTVAASGILLAVTTFVPASLPVTMPAQAETIISVNFAFGSFYDRLQPYGSWVSYEDEYVFVPQHVSRTWRPYTLGHWSYTQRYGWLWVSDERFGWATYHYGRWGYSRDIGWYWVPGHRWAPAWVAWSRGHNRIAWAPLPPRRGTDVDVRITIGDVPDYYWQAVSTSAFLSINLSDKVIRDRNEVRTIVQQSPPETVRIENNIVINNVIQVNEIENATNAKVPVLVEKPVSDPNAVGKIQGNSVTIFNPEVAVDTTAKPKQAVKVEEVVTARKAQGIQPADVPAETAPALDKNGKPITPADQPAVKAQDSTGGNATPEAPAIIKQDPNGTITPKPAVVAPPVKTPEVKTPEVKTPEVKTAPAPVPSAEVPAVAPKKDKTIVTPPADTGTPKIDVPIDKSTKKQDAGKPDPKTIDEKATPPAVTQPPPADGKKAQEPTKKDEKGKTKCDPNIETCPPAE